METSSSRVLQSEADWVNEFKYSFYFWLHSQGCDWFFLLSAILEPRDKAQKIDCHFAAISLGNFPTPSTYPALDQGQWIFCNLPPWRWILKSSMSIWKDREKAHGHLGNKCYEAIIFFSKNPVTSIKLLYYILPTLSP